jgi:hypothetical protein
VPEIQVRKDITILNNQYMESISALAAAKSELEKRRPFISVVDDVRYPLESVGPKSVNQGVISAILGVLIGALLLVGKDFGGDFLHKQKQAFKENQAPSI